MPFCRRKFMEHLLIFRISFSTYGRWQLPDNVNRGIANCRALCKMAIFASPFEPKGANFWGVDMAHCLWDNRYYIAPWLSLCYWGCGGNICVWAAVCANVCTVLYGLRSIWHYDDASPGRAGKTVTNTFCCISILGIRLETQPMFNGTVAHHLRSVIATFIGIYFEAF